MEPYRTKIGQYTALVNGRNGLTIINRKDRYIGASMVVYGEYSYAEQELFKMLVKPADLVVEAGSHIGAHTVGLSRMCEALYAFEPQRLCFQMLCGNLALAECQNVLAFQKAIGAVNGEINVELSDPSIEDANTGGVILADAKSGELVPLVTIDSLDLPRCDFIKADVEEMEVDLVRGATKTIMDCRPTLYLESNHTHRKLVDLLYSMDYVPHWHLPKMFNPGNVFGCRDDIFEGMVSTNVLCLPKERNTHVLGTYEVLRDDPGLDQKKGKPFQVYVRKEAA